MIALPRVFEAPKLEMSRLGGYTIVRKLAKGGMAEIYLARSLGPEGFEKLVVLKRILPKYAENPKFVQLFLDEAKLAASLDHPNVVHVYDMGRVDNHYFFTMEYVHGQDTRSILRKASRIKGHEIPIAIAVQIVRSMASALHHAHERKRPDGAARDIVHRDVSPSNILVSYDGAIKLADFGVAKAATSSVRTRTGALKGKVGYMSPEQARGTMIDRRSDVFSLGVVLWELLAMRRLFKTDNDLATIQAIINTPPPSLTELRDDCPPELDRIARKALEKEPATRYQSAQQLQRDLEELARELKLDQSSISLSSYMTELFADEIIAWRDAQSAGSTVTDFIVAHSGPAATPVSESDFSPEDAEDEELDEDELEADEEVSELAAQEPQPPRAGTIEEPDDATDFGPPPIMEAVLKAMVRPATVNTVPRVQPPVLPRTEREDNPFDNATTRLRAKSHEGDASFNADVPTTVNQNTFLDESPTVSAPPEVLQKAFAETDETVQAIPRYEGPKTIPDTEFPTPISGLYDREAPTTPFVKPSPDQSPYSIKPPELPSIPHVSSLPGVPNPRPPLPGVAKPSSTPPFAAMPQAPPPEPYMPTGFEDNDPALEATGFDPMQPMQTELMQQSTDLVQTELYVNPARNYMPPSHPPDGSFPPPVGSFSQGAMVHQPHAYPMHQPHTHPVGMHAMGYPEGYSEFDPNIDLAPQRRWLIIAGIAVGAMVLVILLVVIFSRGEEEEQPPEETPVEPAPAVKPAPKAEVKPAPKPEVTPAPVVAKPEPKVEPPPMVVVAPKITKPPPVTKKKPRR